MVIACRLSIGTVRMGRVAVVSRSFEKLEELEELESDFDLDELGLAYAVVVTVLVDLAGGT